MARNFSITGPGTAASAPITIIQLHGVNVAYTRVFDITIGGPATAPNDYAATYVLARYTVASTGGTPYTPLPLDPTTGLSALTGGTATTAVTMTSEGTYTAGGSLISIPLNMRATFRYVASPGAEFINTFSAANGLGLRQSASSNAFIPTGTLLWFE